MPLYFRLPLPGPFVYGRRVGGRRRARRSPEETLARARVNQAAARANMARARELRDERRAFAQANPRRYRTNLVLLWVLGLTLAGIVAMVALG